MKQNKLSKITLSSLKISVIIVAFVLVGLTKQAYACPGCMDWDYIDQHCDYIEQMSVGYFDQMGVGYFFHAPNRIERVSDGIIKTGTYSIDQDHGVPFINFYWDNAPNERFLMLRNETFMVLYRDNTEPVFFGFYKHFLPFIRIFQMRNITASSTLREGHIVYAATPVRLGLHINRVWAVEGGVGETLFIQLPENIHAAIYFSIGYVHFSRPYLFQHNSRPKRVRIIASDDFQRSIVYYVEFADTPNFQRINLPHHYWEGDIQIEILEIYPGTVFNHMCINSIMGIEFFGP